MPLTEGFINKSILNFDVEAFDIVRLGKERIPSRNQNYPHASFRFSRVWQGLSKTAIFHRIDTGPIHVPLIDDRCQIPNESLWSPGTIFISVFAGDLRTTNSARVEVIESGYMDGISPVPPEPTNVVVQTPGNSVPFIREMGGEFQYFANGTWNTIKCDGDGGGLTGIYRSSFTQSQWVPYMSDVRLTILATEHGRGLFASVLEVLRESPLLYMENILHTFQRHINGDISLISNLPFDGQVSII